MAEMRYAHEADVLEMLSVKPDNTAAVERLRRLEEGLCEIIDSKMGRSFGSAPVAVTRDLLVTWTGARWFTPVFENLGYGYATNLEAQVRVLQFPVSLRSFISASTGGTWNGAAWIDADPVAPEDVQLFNLEPDGRAWGLYHSQGFWSGVVHVTAIWDDAPTLAVPVDLREAMTFIVADEYRSMMRSPEGVAGPDGMFMSLRNPWSTPRVKAVIDKYRVEQVIV